MRTLKIFGYTAGSVLAVIGFAGIPEDLATWQTWLKPMVDLINQDVARWIFAIVGFLIVAGIMLYPKVSGWIHIKRKAQAPNKPESVGIYLENCEDVELGKNVFYGIDKPIVIKKSKRIKAWLNKAFRKKKNGNG